MLTAIYFVLILGLTIFIHELGHFIFAKKAGVYVHEFALGMGPKIWSFTRKNDPTVYSLRLFPIGGYVSIAGEGSAEDTKVKKKDLIQNKTWMQRFKTIIAGVTFNFIFAIILLFTIGLIWGSPSVKPIVGATPQELQKYPAYKAGIRAGDVILKVNNQKVNAWDDLLLVLASNEGKTVKLTVDKKAGSNQNYTLKPVKYKGQYIYGLVQGYTFEKGFVPAVKFSFLKFGALVKTMYLTIAKLFTGDLAVSNLAGPVGIYQIVDKTTASGIENTIFLIAFLNINIGFINLLPFPAFDGGRIIFLIIEKIGKKPVKPEIENWFHAVGFVLLMALMVLVTWNDIMRLIGG